ncbi:TetR/AcrR family transcriptional regulator [Acidothermaceae bacterium B102]|nr:TetR/AcrR family transcriptional regulator [Acidothermaceae bacterium B102]
MYPVVTPAGPRKASYHHGDLRSALVEAATELARRGGPNAIVLRAAARQVGVSQTAAYRHFADLPELVSAVGDAARQGIAAAMQAELDRVPADADPREQALAHLLAVGRGYVRFALEQPGLFATAFEGVHEEVKPADGERGPYELLQVCLGELIAEGLLDPATREHAAAAAWAAVHGLSTLLLGPMSGVPLAERPAFIDACLGLVAYGLIARP